jgi:hypothetical protein
MAEEVDEDDVRQRQLSRSDRIRFDIPSSVSNYVLLHHISAAQSSAAR